MILQVSQNGRLLKVGRLINVEKSRKKKASGGCWVWSGHLPLSESLRTYPDNFENRDFFSFVTELCVRFRLSIHMQR